MYSLLKQSTASQIITIGPVLNADGTAYVTDNLAYGDFLIGKQGTWAALNSSAAISHVTGDVQGNFKVTLTTGDVDTIGRVELSLNKATLAAPIYRGTVLAAATFDAFITNAAGAADGLAISGASKKVLVSTCDTLTAYTGNTPQTGDAYARTLKILDALAVIKPTAPAWQSANALAESAATAYGFFEGSGTSVADTLPTGHTGTLNGTPSWAATLRGMGVVFNGSSQWLDCGANLSPSALPATLALTLTTPATLSAWKAVFGGSPGTNYAGIQVFLDNAGRIQAGLGSNAGTNSGYQRTFLTTNALSASTYYSIVVVFYSVGTSAFPATDIRVYVNGVLWSGAYAGGDNWTSYAKGTGNSLLGKTTVNGTSYFGDMTIDNTIVANRAWSTADVLAYQTDPWSVMRPLANPPVNAWQFASTSQTPKDLGASVTQTGDAFLIVNDTNYGNAKLVRSTTPANTLSVDANHLVSVPDNQKVDVNTIKTQSITCGAGVTILASVGTASTSTAQTADSNVVLAKVDSLIETIP